MSANVILTRHDSATESAWAAPVTDRRVAPPTADDRLYGKQRIRGRMPGRLSQAAAASAGLPPLIDLHDVPEALMYC